MSSACEIAANSSLNADGGKLLSNGLGGGVGAIRVLEFKFSICNLIDFFWRSNRCRSLELSEIIAPVLISSFTCTYRICVNNEQRVQIEKYDTERQSLGRPSGDFCYSKNREEIQQLLEIAHNNKLDKKQSCQLGEALFASLFDPVLSQDFLNFYFKVV
ncbi:MAG: hypothetical protein WCO29_22740 [Nostocales cyanobacterium ELA583]